VPVAVVALAY